MSTEMQQNGKRPPMSSKTTMFIFGLHSTADDWPSNLSDEHQPKHKKKKQERPPMSSKNKMFIFGLFLTSDDQPSNPSYKSH